MYYNPMMQQVQGYRVGSMQDVVQAQIPFDGSTTYYPCPNQNCIYTKALDLNTGRAIILEYRLVQQEQSKTNVSDLEKRIEKIEQLLQGGNENAINANVANDAR